MSDKRKSTLEIQELTFRQSVENTRLKAENEKLRDLLAAAETLVPYAWHQLTCKRIERGYRLACSCGFAETMDEWRRCNER